MKTYIFRGKEYHSGNKDTVLRRNKVPVSPKNLKTVKKIKTLTIRRCEGTAHGFQNALPWAKARAGV